MGGWGWWDREWDGDGSEHELMIIALKGELEILRARYTRMRKSRGVSLDERIPTSCIQQRLFRMRGSAQDFGVRVQDAHVS